MSDRRLRVIQRGAEGGEDEICALLDRPVRVVLPSGTPPWRHQLLALALVDLLGRLFPRIELIADADAAADARLPPGADLFVERLEAARARGFAPTEPTSEAAVTVAIGSAAGDVHVDASGWQSYVGAQPSRLVANDEDVVPVGPLIAACRSANQVFQLMLGDRLAQPTQIIDSSYSSALTYHSSTDPFDDPALPALTRVDAVLVGAGSIGGASVYLLAHVADLEGELDVVDDDALAEHNPDRAILATEELAARGAVKVDVAADALAHHRRLDVRPHRKRFEEFVGGRPRDTPLPVVLSAVDSVASRREIQDGVPHEVIDAACGLDQISCSGHHTDDGPCVYCLHVQNVLDSEKIKYRLISEATGLPESTVIPLLVQEAALTSQHLAAIEIHRRSLGESVPAGAFDAYLGKTLDTLYREKFLYGEALVKTEGGGQAAVAAPFITALAGFLLGGEALKAAAGDAYAPFRLGPPGQIATMYREDPWGSAVNGLLLNPPRWPTFECLCQSPLRLRLLRARYHL
jgi:hypothetical protein